MSETFQRPFTPAERRYLGLAPAPQPSWHSGTAGAVAASAVVFLIALLLLSFRRDGASTAPLGSLGAAAATFVVAYVIRQRSAWRAWHNHEDRKRSQLKADLAYVTRYQAVSALAVKEFEDEGLSFYLQLEDGSVLFLSGQYLYDTAESKQFPSTLFEISRGSDGRFLSLIPVGQYLAPVAERPPFTEAEYKLDRVPQDGAILQGDLSTFADVAV